MEHLAKRNLKLQSWINFLSGVVFLLPIITVFYGYVGLSIPQIILVSNIGTFAIWIFELPTSVLADTTGRKKSLVASAVFNVLAAFFILAMPSFWGFAIAAFCSALYWSFWSGTGQAFLEENLSILGRRHEFGKVIGHMMFLDQLASLTTPLVASLILKYFTGQGYRILAVLDVVSAFVLLLLVLELSETTQIKNSFRNFEHLLAVNLQTAKEALGNVFKNGKMRLFLLYRSLSHHMLFLPLIVLPWMVGKGMPDWGSGIVMTAATIASMIATKFAYKIGQRFGYGLNWVMGTTAQGVLLILTGWLSQSLLLVACLFVLFNLFDGLWQPAWNHVLVDLTQGRSIATTRSVVFSVFALYMTLGKQFLSIFTVQEALMGLGLFIVMINLLLGKRILGLTKKP